MIGKAAREGVLSSFSGIKDTQRLSIFAEDVALFIRPSVPDLACVREALNIFGLASGLRINYRKTSAILIRGDPEDKERVISFLNCQSGSFPCKYLGLPLAINQLTRTDWQPLLDQVKQFIPAWQRGLIQRPGRLILVKSVIAA